VIQTTVKTVVAKSTNNFHSGYKAFLQLSLILAYHMTNCWQNRSYDSAQTITRRPL